MPVVLYHRFFFQKQGILFCLVFRWYKTTGIRLRQASCRTRFRTRNEGNTRVPLARRGFFLAKNLFPPANRLFRAGVKPSVFQNSRMIRGAAFLSAVLFCHAAHAASAWIEGEANVSVAPASVKAEAVGWGHADWLSGGKWMQVSVDADKVDAGVPGEGVDVSYKFDLAAAGNETVWGRIGYEHVRSPFEWRVDGGAWTRIEPAQNSVDVEELATWNPVAWLRLGTANLQAGAHTLDVRVLKSKDDKGARAKLIFAADAFYLTDGAFFPNGPMRPGDPTAQTAADKAAAKRVVAVAEAKTPTQSATSLAGDWEIAAWDELEVKDRTAPVAELPDQSKLLWRSIAVPSDRQNSRPEMAYVHRYLMRTHVNVPASAANRSFYLHLPSVNLLGSVFVNGTLCGTSDTPFAVWDCDVSRAIKPGQNEIVVALKDVFYALSDAGNAGHPQYTPFDFWHYNTTNQLDFPVLSRYQAGILQTPTLVSTGKVYTSDVFAIPSVKHKSLGLEITVKNPTDAPVSVAISSEVVPVEGGESEKPLAPTPGKIVPIKGESGESEKSFPPTTISLPAKGEKTIKVSEAWANPTLWWPDAPSQYTVLTRVSLGGQIVDERQTKFGFREWDWHGANFSLNGIPWHGRADLAFNGADRDPNAALAAWKKSGQNMFRLWTEFGWGGMDAESTLDWFDAHGVPVRRTGIFDGEGAAGFYNLTQEIQQNGKTERVANRALFDNWHRQLVAWAKGQRNHPSIFIWSMENEITFINSSVFGLNPQTDPEMKKASDLLFALDPTRPQMTDGGNALLDESLPVYGMHYMEPAFVELPNGAYDRAAFAHRQKWPMTGVKPVLAGESYFASGNELSQLATIGGEAAFVGRAEAKPAIGTIARMLSEGYRWQDVNFHFWYGGEAGPMYYPAWQPRAVLCRQWDWSFGSGAKVKRTLGVWNDTHYADPITFTRTLLVGGKEVSRDTQVLKIAPGTHQVLDVSLSMPRVLVRSAGEFVLALSVGGKEVFRDAKPLSVLPAPTFALSSPRVEVRASALVKPKAVANTNAAGSAAGLLVFDPTGHVSAFLKARGVAFSSITSLDALPNAGKVLLVGDNALDARSSTSSALAAWASSGRSVVVLEQKNPLHFGALPGQMAMGSNRGFIAFPEDPDHPVLKGLTPPDFFSWSGDGVVYQDAYAKPTSGGKSLVQCGDGLTDSALAQMNAGRGTLLLCQLVVGEKLDSSPVAAQLLANLLSYGASYKQEFKPTTILTGTNAPLQKALDAVGLQATKADDVAAVLSGAARIAVVDASPATLAALAAKLPDVQKWTSKGGWLVLNNVSPEGLASFNRLVGVEHLMRPYGREKVSFPAVRNPLTAGLATSNVVMGSGKQIFNFAAGQYPDEEAYSYVVDTDDIAPFAKSTYGSYGQITNGYTMNDGFWPLIIDFELPKDGSTMKIPISFARPEKIAGFDWAGSTNYRPTTKIALVPDGDKAQEFSVAPTNDTQTLPFSTNKAVSGLTLELRETQNLPDKGLLTGIGNIWIHPARAADWNKKVRPMLSIGALVSYPQGAGGVVLCNVRFKDSEANPENAGKKQAILKTILANLGAPFSGGKTIIAGAANLSFAPIDISTKANQFRDERGWFGDANLSFKALPTGDQTFAGVKYNVYHFTTSPVPEAIGLGGNGVPGNLPDAVNGIPVGRKADALFFLQAARLDQRRNGDDIKNGKNYEMAAYIVHYADATTARVPVLAEVNVDSYHQTGEAAPLAGAQIAWSAPYAGGKEVAVAYSQQWTNPRPDVAIQSVDFVRGADNRGPVSLLAISAATATKN